MDFNVRSESFAPESRGWLRGPHGTEPGTMPSVTLDLTLFTQATHYPDGHIKSGCVIAQVTATKLWGPFDPDATDGRQNAKGLLFDSENVRTGQTKALNALFVHGFADATRLPYAANVVGGLSAAARAALNLIYWD